LEFKASNAITATFASAPEGEALGDWYVWTSAGASGPWAKVEGSGQAVTASTLIYDFEFSTPGLPAGTYYMIGKGVDNGGTIVADAVHQTNTGRMLENTVLTNVFPFTAVGDSNPQTEVKLAWTPVDGATNGYKIQISSDRVNWVDLSTTALSGQTGDKAALNGAKLSGEIDTQMDTMNVEGLTAGTVYYFRIKAAGTSENSESVAWSITNITTEPSAGQRLITGFGIREKTPGSNAEGTTGVGFQAVTQTAAVLKWTLPAGVPVTPAVEKVTAPEMTGGTMPGMADFSNNLGDTFSDYYVIEYRKAGDEAWAELPLGSSVPSQGGTPRIQTNFDERAIYINGINLQGARTTQANIIGLASNASYEFRMMAKAVDGNEATDWSPIVSVTTGYAAGLYASAALSTDREATKAKNFKVDSSTATTIALTWDGVVGPNGNAAQLYVIRYREAGTDTWYTWGPNTTAVALDNLSNSGLSGLTPFYQIQGTATTITGLSEGQEYEFQIKAIAKFGGGGDTYHYAQGIGDGGGVQADWSDTLTAKAELVLPPALPNPPNAVTAVTFGSVAGVNVSYTWTAPATDASHDAVDSYTVAYRFDGGEWQAANSAWIVGTTVNISLDGLEPETDYGIDVLVQAKNAGGVSNWVGLTNGFITTEPGGEEPGDEP
jgi:hypothetical protein